MINILLRYNINVRDHQTYGPDETITHRSRGKQNVF